MLSAFDITSDKIEEVVVAPMEENGKDLPLGKNHGDYVNSKGRMVVDHCPAGGSSAYC